MNPKNHSLLSLARLSELGITLKTDITVVLHQGRRGTYHTGSCSQARYASEEVILKDLLENEKNLLCLCLNHARMLVPQSSETRLRKNHFVGSLSVEEVADAASVFTQTPAFSGTAAESSFEDKIAEFKKSVVALSFLGYDGSSMRLYRPAVTLNLFDISDEGYKKLLLAKGKQHYITREAEWDLTVKHQAETESWMVEAILDIFGKRAAYHRSTWGDTQTHLLMAHVTDSEYGPRDGGFKLTPQECNGSFIDMLTDYQACQWLTSVMLDDSKYFKAADEWCTIIDYWLVGFARNVDIVVDGGMEYEMIEVEGAIDQEKLYQWKQLAELHLNNAPRVTKGRRSRISTDDKLEAFAKAYETLQKLN